MPSNIVTGKRIRLLYGNGANHWQKEKMINQLFIKFSNYLFKETFNCDYIIYGKIDKDDSVHMIEIKEFDEYSKDIQTVIQNMIRDVNDSM